MADQSTCYAFLSFLWSSRDAIDLEKFSNSAFTTSLVGAIAGAYAGAKAAQRTASKDKRKDDLRTEIRSTNAAILTCGSIFDTAFALKRQRIQPLIEQYCRDRANFQRELQARQSGARQGNAPIHFETNLVTLHAPRVEAELLHTLVFERISVSPRSLRYVNVLIQSIDALLSVIRERNLVVERLRAMSREEDADRRILYAYFGERDDRGLDTSYPDYVEALGQKCDEVLVIAEQISEQLTQHGKNLKAEYKRSFKKDVPDVAVVSFQAAYDQGVMPPRENFLTLFSSLDSAPT